MNKLSTEEIQKAIALIANRPFDPDVITAVRHLLLKKENQLQATKGILNRIFTPPDPDDTKPFTAMEYDGD